MTEQEKRARLAELLGWTEIFCDPYDGAAWMGTRPDGHMRALPDWCTNLEDAHALGEEMRKRGLMRQYLDTLFWMSMRDDQFKPSASRRWDEWLLLASAAVRADAALKVLEK